MELPVSRLDLRRASPGQPLPAGVRQALEGVFQASFGEVRVHVGPEAPALGALAFTVGSAVHFAPGHYDPHSARGLRLLGHELTHVLQQRRGRVVNPFGAGVAIVHEPALEAEAERMGLRAAQMAPLPAPRPVSSVKASPVSPRSPVSPISPVSPVSPVAPISLRSPVAPRSGRPAIQPYRPAGMPLRPSPVRPVRGHGCVLQRMEKKPPEENFPFKIDEEPKLYDEFSILELSQFAPRLLENSEHKYTQTVRESTSNSHYAMIFLNDENLHASFYPSNPESDPFNQNYSDQVKENLTQEDVRQFNQEVAQDDDAFYGLTFNQFHITVGNEKKAQKNAHFFFNLSGDLIPGPSKTSSLKKQKKAYRKLGEKEREDLDRFHDVLMRPIRLIRKRKKKKLDRDFKRLIQYGRLTMNRTTGGPPTLAERAARSYFRNHLK
ncbi:MAG TPA: DUF4157 domain-containing protein [Thermoanaerobaculia bacterium]|nr:DUF4157 domain-containing protein [Thermoanaerobaculia bacterium]